MYLNEKYRRFTEKNRLSGQVLGVFLLRHLTPASEMLYFDYILNIFEIWFSSLINKHVEFKLENSNIPPLSDH